MCVNTYTHKKCHCINLQGKLSTINTEANAFLSTGTSHGNKIIGQQRKTAISAYPNVFLFTLDYFWEQRIPFKRMYGLDGWVGTHLRSGQSWGSHCPSNW